MSKLNQITIEGFKSIQKLEAFKLSNLNVLIGGNGAGKSNFIDVFRMLRAMMMNGLEGFARERGGADGFFYGGPQQTEHIKLEFDFGNNEYRFALSTTADELFLIEEEQQKYKEGGSWKTIAHQVFESALPQEKDASGIYTKRGVGYYVHQAISNWVVYHFHDTSPTAAMRRYEIVEHCEKLAPNASNIAPFLLHLKNHPKHRENYQRIVETLRLVIPFFDDFILKPRMFAGEKEKVRLTWRQKGTDFPMQPYHLSDGSIRFICLVTALLQPRGTLPSTILIDEPELGLHPYAIEVLADVIQEAAEKTQIIISTQSPLLVDFFEPENIITVNRKNNSSTFERLDSKSLEHWLEDYSLGELWQKNIVLGAPSHEL